jgi:hypothetical protein
LQTKVKDYKKVEQINKEGKAKLNLAGERVHNGV